MKIKNIYNASSAYFKNPYFGFTQGHTYLSSDDLKLIEKEIGKSNQAVTECFERSFSRLVGGGQSVCFGAGRMGFYALMEVLNIGKGDEVILQAATCSVMPNAILRRGATPVYADIDPNTFGSCVHAIEKVLSGRTRLIVAQHSFGIPCDILSIIELARRKEIFLLEDCALTLGSKIDDMNCGNFGDASLFSTDHTKPINTIIGGLIYTRNKKLHAQLKARQSQACELPAWKQKAIWKQLLFEREYHRPDNYGKSKLISPLRSKLKFAGKPFLDEDFRPTASTGYPYPSKMPGFLARLGSREMDRWDDTSRIRRKLAEKLLHFFSEYRNVNLIPNGYLDSKNEITPLRFAWHEINGKQIRDSLSDYIDTSSTWFMAPIIGTKEPLENYGYVWGSCPKAESIGPSMVNIPCCVSEEWQDELVSKLSRLSHEF